MYNVCAMYVLCWGQIHKNQHMVLKLMVLPREGTNITNTKNLKNKPLDRLLNFVGRFIDLTVFLSSPQHLC